MGTIWLSRAGEKNDLFWGARKAATGFKRNRDDRERQGHRHLEGERDNETGTERFEKERTAMEKAEIESEN